MVYIDHKCFTQDVWDKPATKLTPEDDNHVLVLYVETWGVTKFCPYEVSTEL